MQITETLAEPLRREFTIVVDLKDLDERLTGRVTEMQPKIHLKGFRPGKAPVSFLKKAYRKSLMGEIVNDAVTTTSEQVLKDKALKPATTPQVDFVNALESVIDGKADLEFTMKVDLMPDFTLANLSALKAERLVADVEDDALDEALGRLADSQKVYTDKGEGAVAEKGDMITIDFKGTIDGEPFEGGARDGFDLTLGSGAFIPGFEDQLIGVKAGDERSVDVTFPDDYGSAKLAGKPAVFAVKVHAVKAASPVPIDDELAKKIGLDSLDMLKERVRDQLKGDYVRTSRTHMKRRILDALDEAHSFDLPKGMVDAEFENIWRQVEAELAREGTSPEDEGKTEEEMRAEYRAIAERRVRLGLVLAKIGEQNAITIGQDEVNRALAARAQQFPGQEKQVIEFYTSNPQAMAEIRVPLFEDKVIDFLGELMDVKDRKVSRDILFLDPDEAAEKLKEEEAPAEKSAKKAKAKTETKPKAKSDEKPKAKKGDEKPKTRKKKE